MTNFCGDNFPRLRAQPVRVLICLMIKALCNLLALYWDRVAFYEHGSQNILANHFRL